VGRSECRHWFRSERVSRSCKRLGSMRIAAGSGDDRTAEDLLRRALRRIEESLQYGTGHVREFGWAVFEPECEVNHPHAEREGKRESPALCRGSEGMSRPNQGFAAAGLGGAGPVGSAFGGVGPGPPRVPYASSPVHPSSILALVSVGGVGYESGVVGGVTSCVGGVSVFGGAPGSGIVLWRLRAARRAGLPDRRLTDGALAVRAIG